MEFGHGNARDARSTSLAIDLWIKTCKNALKSQIDPKAIWGYFWWKFLNFSKSKKILVDLWGKQSQIRGNHALIPYDEVWYQIKNKVWLFLWGFSNFDQEQEKLGEIGGNTSRIRVNLEL